MTDGISVMDAWDPGPRPTPNGVSCPPQIPRPDAVVETVGASSSGANAHCPEACSFSSGSVVRVIRHVAPRPGEPDRYR